MPASPIFLGWTEWELLVDRDGVVVRTLRWRAGCGRDLLTTTLPRAVPLIGVPAGEGRTCS